MRFVKKRWSLFYSPIITFVLRGLFILLLLRLFWDVFKGDSLQGAAAAASAAA